MVDAKVAASKYLEADAVISNTVCTQRSVECGGAQVEEVFIVIAGIDPKQP
ncbi:hypothetical protein [Saccharopolyspora elongata]|uniref:hypothetical protein n=1 Tax=Saccharopolyspora elongata TaxID=2530387 RepID=UPI00140428C4|nr:hypothetical protein [Saccharopolyspora elongata]